jgi:AcrR family transcriptional regulator
MSVPTPEDGDFDPPPRTEADQHLARVPSPIGRATRRDEILDAAASLFARHGFRGVGIDEIGAAVGISGPALYRHFASKDAMLREMLVRISERLLSEGGRRAEQSGEPAETLDALIRWHVDFALGHPALITVHDRELGTLGEADARHIRHVQRLYVEIWVEVLRRLRPDLAPAVARARVHAVFGLLNSTPHSIGELSRDALGSLLREMALAALLIGDGAPPAQAPDSTAEK